MKKGGVKGDFSRESKEEEKHGGGGKKNAGVEKSKTVKKEGVGRNMYHDVIVVGRLRGKASTPSTRGALRSVTNRGFILMNKRKKKQKKK